MLYLFTDDSENGTPLASEEDWQAFASWAKPLHTDFPQLGHLTKHGWTPNVPGVLMDMARAAMTHETPTNGAKEAATNLVHVLRSGPRVVVVSQKESEAVALSSQRTNADSAIDNVQQKAMTANAVFYDALQKELDAALSKKNS